VHHSNGAIFVCEHVRGTVFRRAISGETVHLDVHDFFIEFALSSRAPWFASPSPSIIEEARRHQQRKVATASYLYSVRELPLCFFFFIFSMNHTI
jgi:hypothetical protein